MAELVISGLSKVFGGRVVLSGVDLTVASGTLMAVLGASGSGKTTLLRLVCGFERANAGSICIAGRMVAGPGLHRAPERRRIGYVAQEGALFPHLSVADNIVFGLSRRQRRVRHRVDELLRLVGLSPGYAARLPSELSGGEQQRVALARALAPGPALVLLDEPFSALDAALRAGTRQAVATAIADAGATAVLVTHDQAEALSMGREVAVLRGGRLIQVATPHELYQRPVDIALAQFVGEAVVLPGVAGDGVVRCALGSLATSCGAYGPVQVLIRPEQIRFVASGGVEGSVVAVTFYGPEASVGLSLPDGTLITARAPGYVDLTPGERVCVTVDGEIVTYPWVEAQPARV